MEQKLKDKRKKRTTSKRSKNLLKVTAHRAKTQRQAQKEDDLREVQEPIGSDCSWSRNSKRSESKRTTSKRSKNLLKVTAHGTETERQAQKEDDLKEVQEPIESDCSWSSNSKRSASKRTTSKRSKNLLKVTAHGTETERQAQKEDDLKEVQEPIESDCSSKQKLKEKRKQEDDLKEVQKPIGSDCSWSRNSKRSESKMKTSKRSKNLLEVTADGAETRRETKAR
ncbi:centromere protein C-like [Nilaparvata lugens]|uniref:centromere protein C-like n=1 Tax=Nilaparvata lugens TaxID=108931 RepID=UPI00193EB6A8|nr:centromere protein C-like [Nilaparvata lugens]